jgi:hypothetical protein
MSYIRTKPYDEKDFPAFAMMREQFGFLPNFFRAQVARPDLINTEAALSAAIQITDGALSRKQKEYIFPGLLGGKLEHLLRHGALRNCPHAED